MKKIFTFSLLIIISNLILFGQSNDSWTLFWDNDTTYIGYKDKNGFVKIEPKFLGYTNANKFEDIIAATEDTNGEWEHYYLTKKGKIVGRDSLYSFDNTADCENEGFIRFRDKKTDKAGILNKNGDIVVPAEYNDLTNVRNGMIVALKGAEKQHIACGEHFNWIGGKEILIDTNNNVLIDDYKRNDNLNFFSVKISNKISSDPLRQSFKSADGQYYSFVNFDLEFKTWLKKDLLNDLSKENLLRLTHDEITYWEHCNGWITEQKTAFFERNFELIKSILMEIKSEKCEYIIFVNELSNGIYESEYFEKFFNNCGDAKDWMYPLKIVSTIDKSKKNYYQKHFNFLRTENGYRLISVSLKDEK